ncbi:lysozyme 1-like [Ptychodera flava]|uniref:lysozyme 1-like n=1 Tax=Ptychodera flava TaxID=63121 RepID=UPI00396AAEF3
MPRLIFLASLLTVVSCGYVPQPCLDCICFVESNCRMPSSGPTGYEHCAWDVGSYSCGPYQIKEVYWIDARMYGGYLMGDWLTCTNNWGCSEDSVHAYMERYATRARLGTDPTCEHFSRIHNGGPNGHTNPNTLVYWNKVQDCLNRSLCCPAPPV